MAGGWRGNPNMNIRGNQLKHVCWHVFVETSGHASVVVYNAIGQHVATLFDEIAEAGRYYRVRFGGDNFSSGTYFCQLVSGKRSEMKKLVLIK